jgi:predicted GNAT family acetyltransferase
VECPADVFRIDTEEQAQRLSLATGSRPTPAEHLFQRPRQKRQFCAELDGEIVGWVHSIQLRPNIASCFNMYVKPEFRRRGIAKALLSRMLADDREHGALHNVLLASHAGAKLYPAVGYEQIGTLHLFCPLKKRS